MARDSQGDSARIGYAVVAAITGMPIGTVRAKVSRGEIPHLRYGPRLVRFDRAEIERWVEQHRVPAGGDPCGT